MQEYWVNVYKYSKLKEYCYSHGILNKRDAIAYSSESWARHLIEGTDTKLPRKCLYRIHVKLKAIKL